ncbi:MAG TPA: alpha/beta hydrolase, partial [Chthonomonadaceae bacterium]|nr:alpha/beta hydrolase [Chthonomonadaceae bacterium]
VLAHSLGSINWMHFAAARGADAPPVADRVLLVAPPYIVPQILPIDVVPEVAAFFPPPCSPSGIQAAAHQTVLIASDTDDYATFDQSCGYARDLDIPIHKLPGAGHISPYYGYGEWPWALDWCLGRADLPPVPREG